MERDTELEVSVAQRVEDVTPMLIAAGVDIELKEETEDNISLHGLRDKTESSRA